MKEGGYIQNTYPNTLLNSFIISYAIDSV